MGRIATAWREVEDPHWAGYYWRMRAFQLEWRAFLLGFRARNPVLADTGRQTIHGDTPERRALWADLFLHP